MFDKDRLINALTEYKRGFAERWDGAKRKEKFKWQAVKCFQDNWNIDEDDFADMLSRSLDKTGSLLASAMYFPKSLIIEFAKAFPKEVKQMFADLYNENVNVAERISRFKEKSSELLMRLGKGAANHYQNENAVTIYLWLRYPDKYYIYKLSEIKNVVSKLNASYTFKKGGYEDNIHNFMLMYDELCAAIQKDDELLTIFRSSLTDDCYPDPELKTLTIDIGVYISQEYLETGEFPIDWGEWFPIDYTPGFTVEEWVELLNDKEVFRESNLEIMKRLKDIGEATCTQLAEKYGESPNYYNAGTSSLGNRIINKTGCPTWKREKGVARKWSVLFLGKHPQKGDSGSVIWKLRDELSQALDKIDLSGIQLYAEEESPVSTSTEYLNDLSRTLIESKNIILRGAPGTGKSYLAKRIAADIVSDGRTDNYHALSDEEKKQTEFVQFHPSFDYSDFVEGLRPIINDDGSMGFELQDGIFKKFVSEAAQNYEDAHKEQSARDKELSVQEAIDEFLTDYNPDTMKLKTVNGNDFVVTTYDDKHINVHIENNPIVKDLRLSLSEIRKMLESDTIFTKVKDITDFFGKTHHKQHYSYNFAIYNEIKDRVENRKQPQSKKVKEQKYVFIIDEINRGEISKIFGELFFAIDPGYRGESGKVSTQYSNMHPVTEEKFYIPENVYIIGTMNDIDRSVDSFDFAMRRRFRFIELKANEQTEMLSVLGDKRYEAIARMRALNDVIKSTPDLNENYQIGAAYFLKLKTLSYEQLWTDYLKPLLHEYIQGMYNEDEIMKKFETAYGTSYTAMSTGDEDEINADS